MFGNSIFYFLSPYHNHKFNFRRKTLCVLRLSTGYKCLDLQIGRLYLARYAHFINGETSTLS